MTSGDVSAGTTVQGVFVDGGSRAGTHPLPLINPSTGRAERLLAAAGPEDVEAVVRSAAAAHRARAWSGLPAIECQRVLAELARRVRGAAARLGAVISRESGLPLGPARYVEVPMAADALDYFAACCTAEQGEVVPFFSPGGPSTQLAFTLRQSGGPAALIVPSNFPLLLAAWKLGAALAAGSPAILKPGPETPSPAMHLAALATEAGVPPGVVGVVAGGAEIGAALVDDARVPCVSFTGGNAVGRSVMARAARHLKRLTLELGGKSAVIVCADADLDAAVDSCLFGVFFHAGQVCQAGSRLLVAASIYDAFCQRLADRASRLSVGPADDPGSDLGPLLTARHWDRVRALVAEGVDAGAKLVVGGAPPHAPSGGFFFPPTVLSEPPPGTGVAREEVFGPVACVFRMADEASALEAANAGPYGLAAGIWTRDLRRALALAGALEAGTVWINTAQVLSPTAPFGGWKQSGLGRELGRQALATFRETKTVIVEGAERPTTYF